MPFTSRGNELMLSIVAVGGIALAAIVVVSVKVPKDSVMLITLIGGFVGTIIAQLIAADKNAVRQEKVADVIIKKTEVSEQKVLEVDKKVDSLAVVAEKTYAQGNSAMGIQLKAVADLAHFKADTTLRASDQMAAESADKAYINHQAMQATLNGLGAAVPSTPAAAAKTPITQPSTSQLPTTQLPTNVTIEHVEMVAETVNLTQEEKKQLAEKQKLEDEKKETS